MAITRRRRWPLIVFAILLALPLTAFVALRAFVSPDALAPRLIAAVEAATGRRFTIGGMEIALSLRPGVVLRDITLSNAPGGSRAEMLTARRAEVIVALIPLLFNRIEIVSVELEALDLLLETDGEGNGNWQFRASAAAPAPRPTAAPSPAPSRPPAIAVERLTMTGARVVLPGAPPIDVKTLQASAPLNGSITTRGTIALGGHEMTLHARSNPLWAGTAPMETSFALAGPLAEARGAVTLTPGARARLTGRVEIARLNLGAADIVGPPPVAAAAPATATPTPQVPPAPRDPRAVPDRTLRLGALRALDADLAITITALNARGTNWSDIAVPVHLDNGRLRIAPFAVATPGGKLTGEFAIDAAATPPAVAVRLAAPGLDLGQLQQAFGQPMRITGHGEVEADLRATGATTRALAGSLAGHIGLAMLDAMLEPPLIEPAQQALRARVGVLPPLPARLPVDCVALRGDAAEGVLRIGTLLVDAPAAKVSGTGVISLREETVALRLLHDVRAAGQSVRVSADFGGDFRSVQFRGVRAENLAEVVAGAASRLGGDLGAIIGSMARSAARAEPLPECAPALATARAGREGRLPAPRSAPPEGVPQ